MSLGCHNYMFMSSCNGDPQGQFGRSGHCLKPLLFQQQQQQQKRAVNRLSFKYSISQSTNIFLVIFLILLTTTLSLQSVSSPMTFFMLARYSVHVLMVLLTVSVCSCRSIGFGEGDIQYLYLNL